MHAVSGFLLIVPVALLIAATASTRLSSVLSQFLITSEKRSRNGSYMLLHSNMYGSEANPPKLYKQVGVRLNL